MRVKTAFKEWSSKQPILRFALSVFVLFCFFDCLFLVVFDFCFEDKLVFKGYAMIQE